MTTASITWQTEPAPTFHWVNLHGERATLSEVAAEPDSAPYRLLPSHLEALDGVLMDAVKRWGEVLGGGRPPDAADQAGLSSLSRELDRLTVEYAQALAEHNPRPSLRAGQIVGTAALVGRRARMALGVAAPEPLADQLEEPPVGVVSGFAELVPLDPDRPDLGARWVVRTEAGPRLPANLQMLLRDSSGVLKDAAVDEHRAALRQVVAAEGTARPVPAWLAALDWLLYDFLLAMRESPSSAGITLRPGAREDVTLIISAAAAAARAREATQDRS